MNRREMRRFFASEHRGLVLGSGRLAERASFTNLALVAPTGSGKTTRYVIPNVLAAHGSVVVTDPSGEIFAATAAHLRSRGFDVRALRPGDVGQSERFNPLAWWRSPQQLRQLALVLGQSIQSPGADPFWSTSAINLLWVGLAVVATGSEKSATLGNLRAFLNQVGGEEREVLDRYAARRLDSQTLAEYRAVVEQEPKVLSSVIATARAALELWSDAEVRLLTETSTLNLRNLRKRLTAIYIIVPEHQVKYFAPLLNVFYSTCFSLCLEGGGDPKNLPVYFFLDEFGNLGPVHNIAGVMTTLRKRHCSVSIILQELSQLRSVYGPAEAQTIFSGGCANKLFFSGLDLETATYVEQALGQNTEYDTTFGGVSAQARTLGVPLLRADEVRRLPADQAILLSGRERPVRLRMRSYFV